MLQLENEENLEETPVRVCSQYYMNQFLLLRTQEEVDRCIANNDLENRRTLTEQLAEFLNQCPSLSGSLMSIALSKDELIRQMNAFAYKAKFRVVKEYNMELIRFNETINYWRVWLRVD